jgi:hypothetical protein
MSTSNIVAVAGNVIDNLLGHVMVAPADKQSAISI